MANVPIIKLNDCCKIPAIGLGTSRSSKTECELAVKFAVDVGYRHFDTAYLYHNETAIGNALREKIDVGVVTRDELFVVTKLWNTFHGEDQVERICRQSLENLGLNYIDLYIMHFPIAYVYTIDEDFSPKDDHGNLLTSNLDYLVTWRAMERLVDLGLVKSLGVANFNSAQITRLLEHCEIKPAAIQIECSLLINQKKFIKFCMDRDIIVIAYAPLGRPSVDRLTPAYFNDQKVQQIAAKFNKSVPQVILRYLFELGAIPIPKSVTKSRIEANIDIFDFKLTEEDTACLDSFNTNERIVAMPELIDHKYYPFSIEF